MTDKSLSPRQQQQEQQQPPIDPLLQSIRQLVRTTNMALASFEQSTSTTAHSLTSRLSSLSSQARLIASRVVAAYDHRGYYGPQICAGVTCLVGGLTGLRRGKFTGGLAGGIGGLIAYGNIYGLNYESWRNKL
eukprot:scaffold140672_cov76-Cyclotella_meneghiniana.AAC.4